MSGQTFTLPSFAKVNLFLRVLGRRDDDFHEICTVFQTISLHDKLTFTAHESLLLTCDDAEIPTGGKNLIIKAAEILRKKFNIKKGAQIHLEKSVPAPGGLGGGSSNAAAALFGLIKLWQIEIDFAGLSKIGETLGSDVPFFFYGGTALGTGRGTVISPLDDFSEKHMLIVTPKVNVSTAAAFAQLNASHLTNNTSKSILQICRNDARTLDLRQSELVNDFEKVIFELEPEIGRVKRKLLNFGIRRVLLSGSGASVFAVFDDKTQMQTAFYNLKSEKNWRIFPVKTVSRRKYREMLDIDSKLFPKDF